MIRVSIVKRWKGNKPAVQSESSKSSVPSTFIKRLTKKKNLKQVVYEKMKSDVILNEGEARSRDYHSVLFTRLSVNLRKGRFWAKGRMFQIQSQLSTLCVISSAYAFYNAYLTDDIDGVLLDSEKIALEAAHFKESGSASKII